MDLGKKIIIKIKFNEETNEIEIRCKPKDSKPSKLIKVLTISIEALNKVIEEEIGEEETPSYIH